jgi:hypothetical protein
MWVERLDLKAPRFDEDSFRLTPIVFLENIIEALVDLNLKFLAPIHLSAGVKVLESLRVAA